MKKLIFLLIALCSFVVSAEPVKEIIFFGDSLSDNGNLYAASHQVIPRSPPYFNGRFSNGPVWAEMVAEFYQNNYGIHSSNFAVGGATVILRRPREGALPYYLKKEINSYLQKSDFPERSQTLYFLWMGGNDYMDEKKEAPEKLVDDVVGEMIAQIKVLITNGGKRFVLLDLPDFSQTPYGSQLDQTARERVRQLSILNHFKLQTAVSELKVAYPNFTFILIDVFSFFNNMLQDIDQYNEKYNTHITNVSDACWMGGYTLAKQKLTDQLAADFGKSANATTILQSTTLLEAYQVGYLASQGASPCNAPDEYLFWDNVHPTTISHQIMSKIIIDTLESQSAVK